jgi:hypothetical protein
MSAAVAQELTLANVLQQLGGISPRRVRFRPAPGTATEEDVVKIRDRERRLFELVDGVLVEKVMGYWESMLAIAERRRCPAGLPAPLTKVVRALGRDGVAPTQLHAFVHRGAP